MKKVQWSIFCLLKGLSLYVGGLGVLCSLGSGWVSAKSMPQWSSEDRERLSKGELIAGASLLVDSPRPTSSGELKPQPDTPKLPDPVEPVKPADPIDPEASDEILDAHLIPEKYVVEYFSTSPQTYLIDPQRLFSNQETIDREGFLRYYADESEIDVRIYLFDAEQEIPPEHSLEKLLANQYAEGPLTAVVFYFLGNPQRNQLMFGGKGAEVVGAEKLRKMLDSAKIKAMEKTNPTSQMESFIVQLSISTYWVEQGILDERTSKLVIATEPSAESADEIAASPNAAGLEKIQPYLLYGIVAVISAGMVLFSLVGAWVLWCRSRRYTFPVLEMPRRLGADYAAGIGAVIEFRNNLDSPSNQRKKIPEYLTKL